VHIVPEGYNTYLCWVCGELQLWNWSDEKIFCSKMNFAKYIKTFEGVRIISSIHLSTALHKHFFQYCHQRQKVANSSNNYVTPIFHFSFDRQGNQTAYCRQWGPFIGHQLLVKVAACIVHLSTSAHILRLAHIILKNNFFHILSVLMRRLFCLPSPH